MRIVVGLVSLFVLLVGYSLSAQSIPGCHDGRLTEPRVYVSGLLQRAGGSPAPDWAAVLTASGLPNGPDPGQQTNPKVHYGITQQIGAGGPRGRIFLPTAQPDSLGYYTHPIDVLVGEAGDLRWGWNDWLGGPPYQPAPCGVSGPQEPQQPQQPQVPDETLQARLTALAVRLDEVYTLLQRHDEKPMWITKVLRRREVQMAMAAISTWIMARATQGDPKGSTIGDQP